MLLQETNLKGKSTTIKIPEYDTITGGEKPRACILIHKALRYRVVKELSNRDVVTIVLETREMEVLIVSGYMDENIAQIDGKFGEAMDYANQNGMETIIGADANAKSTWWFNGESNKRGENLENWILEHNMEVSNRGNRPTWENIRYSSITDVTLVSQGLRDRIRDWKVSEENMDSDHRLIEFELDSETQKRTMKTRNLKKANWDKFRSLLNKNKFISKHFWTEVDIEQEAGLIENQIMEALDVVANVKVIKHKNKNDIGHDQGIQDQSKRVKTAGRRYKKNPTDQHKEKLKEHRKKLKKWSENLKAESGKTSVNP